MAKSPFAQSKPEHILCAAIHYVKESSVDLIHKCVNIKEGVVLTGWRHPHIINLYYQLTKKKSSQVIHIQGFLTSHNRFVDRSEGADIARKCGQVHYMQTLRDGKLHSEDLY